MRKLAFALLAAAVVLGAHAGGAPQAGSGDGKRADSGGSRTKIRFQIRPFTLLPCFFTVEQWECAKYRRVFHGGTVGRRIATDSVNI